MHKSFLIFNLVSLILLFSSCEKTKLPVLPEGKALQLQVAEAGVTEAWLQVKIGVKEPGQQLRLYRQGELVQQLAIDRDTVVYDSGLAPAHRYTYHAELWKTGSLLGKTNSITLTTMDTTSHDFQWEVVTIPSPFGSGALYDVAIIDENDIWAVGEIYSDSTQPWLPYNAVHWNGEEWELMRIPFYDETGYAWYTPIKSILAFSSDDIWFEAGIHWNGVKYESRPLEINFPSHVNKMWGTSSSDFYIVGNQGLIAHYNGQSWKRIESGTDLPIQDIWGTMDWDKGKYYILAPASLKYNWEVPRLLNITVSGAAEEFLTIYNRLHSVWFKTPEKIYLCGGGVHYRINKTWKTIPNLSEIFTNRIRGNDYNDIWVVGDFGIAFHFNGVNWKKFPGLWLGDGNWEGLSLRNNYVVVVGWKGNNGIISIIKPNY